MCGNIAGFISLSICFLSFPVFLLCYHRFYKPLSFDGKDDKKLLFFVIIGLVLCYLLASPMHKLITNVLCSILH